ncbi:MAG: hypothetical protein LBT89_08885 [Planctomycetaceae bacterium]|jgi:hypothetical protein|nr:hypothetical protein [Planctomycetaceae bacterium]
MAFLINEGRNRGFSGFPNFYPLLVNWCNPADATGWAIAYGAEALIGHDVLQMYESEKTTPAEKQNEYGLIHQEIDEYGYAVYVPGKYKSVSYGPGGLDDFVLGQTYEPEIKYTDALGLGGMSLSDRKTFLTTVQGVLDKIAPGLDARQLKYSTGFLSTSDMQKNRYSLTVETQYGVDLKNLKGRIEEALNQNKSLYLMKSKADASADKTLGNYTISVTDKSGIPLAKNAIILTAGGKSVQTTVDVIRNWNHQQIINFIMQGK